MVQRQKLELQINTPTEIIMLFDECVEGSSSYGKYFLYAVSSNGEEYSYFASETVHDQIKTLVKDDRAIITKRTLKYDAMATAEFDVKLLPRNKTKGLTVLNNNQAKDNYYDLMLSSMRDAIKLQSELQAPINIEKLGITLFIQRTKQSVYR